MAGGAAAPSAEQAAFLALLREQQLRHEGAIQKMFLDQAELISSKVLAALVSEDDGGSLSNNPEGEELKSRMSSEAEPMALSESLEKPDDGRGSPCSTLDAWQEKETRKSARSQAVESRPSRKSRSIWEKLVVTDDPVPFFSTEGSHGPPTVEDVRQCRLQPLAKYVESSRGFQVLMEVLIFANGVLIGVQTDHAAKHLGEPLSRSWLLMDAAFALAFCVELFIRVAASGRFFWSRHNGDRWWNLFDALLVASANVEVCLKLAEQKTFVDISTGRILRMMRLVRIVRVVRVLRFFKDLRVMVLSIMSSLRPLFFALCLLAMLIYVVSTFFMHFATEELIRLRSSVGEDSDDFRELHHHYGTLITSAQTLFMSITGGINWGESVAPLWKISDTLGTCFLLYMSFSMFCVLNIITGIFVQEATTKTCEDEENMIIRELEKRKRFIAEAKRFFEEADKDGSGQLSWPEFEERLQHLRMQKLLEHLGVDVIACGVENVFNLFDFDGNGAIAVSEFAAGLQRLGGGARSIEIAGMRWDQQRLLGDVADLNRDVKEILECSKQASQLLQQQRLARCRSVIRESAAFRSASSGSTTPADAAALLQRGGCKAGAEFKTRL